LARLTLDLPAAGARQPVELGLAVVLGDAPLRIDIAFLLELHELGIERAVIEREAIAARLLDAPRDAVAVQRPEALERFQDHQRERALPDVGLVRHAAPMG